MENNKNLLLHVTPEGKVTFQELPPDTLVDIAKTMANTTEVTDYLEQMCLLFVSELGRLSKENKALRDYQRGIFNDALQRLDKIEAELEEQKTTLQVIDATNEEIAGIVHEMASRLDALEESLGEGI